MANFPPIQFKRTNVVGRAPTDSDILVGELAINLRDRIIFTKDDSDHIVAFGFTPEYDSDILKLAHDYVAADSELKQELRADFDSDLTKIRHDFVAADSDLRVALETITGHDSDLVVIRHDFAAADSDLQVQILELDSDVIAVRHDFLAGDSDIIAQLSVGVDSDLAQLRHDFEASDSDLRVTLESISQHDSDFAKATHDYAAADSDLKVILESAFDHDSDLSVIRHNFLAADSDLRATSLAMIDSDIRLLKENDSDQQILIDSIDSDLANLRLDSLLDVNAPAPTSGQTLVWDSDAAEWVAGQGSTVGAINDLTDVDTVTLVPIHGDALVWDSDSELWKPGQSSKVKVIGDLDDVDETVLPKHGDLFAWDSDIAQWKPTSFQTVTVLKSETFTATAGQTSFTLQYAPAGDIQTARNGVVIASGSITIDSDVYAIYNAAANNNQVLVAGDRIDVQYAYSSLGVRNIGSLSLADFQDVSSTPPADGEVLVWDSVTSTWIPVPAGTPTAIDGGGA